MAWINLNQPNATQWFKAKVTMPHCGVELLRNPDIIADIPGSTTEACTGSAEPFDDEEAKSLKFPIKSNGAQV